MMRLTKQLICRFSNGGQNDGIIKEIAYSMYQSGKSSVSISQNLTSFTNLNFSNFYMHENLCSTFDKSIVEGSAKAEGEINNTTKVFRFIIEASIGKKQISLDINSLRKNKIIDELFELQQRNKYAVKSARIIIDDWVQDNPDVDMNKRLQNNMLEIQKLLETGCNLSVSYMISHRNVGCSHWMNVTKRKPKAIHTNIIEKLKHNSEHHKSFQQFVFNNGYRAQHLFLKPYRDGKEVENLSEANNFSLKELVNVLNIIDFQGKIVLQDNSHFLPNVIILEEALKKGGFMKKKLGQQEGPMWYLFL